jgi:hypothetical protein
MKPRTLVGVAAIALAAALIEACDDTDSTEP